MAAVLLITPFSLALTLPLPGWAVLLTISLFGVFGSGCLIPQNLLMAHYGRHLERGRSSEL